MSPPQAIVRPVPTAPVVPASPALEVLAYCARVLWQARNAAGLSRREVGLRLGLHRNTIRDFELARYWLAMPKVLEYASLVQVPYAALFAPDLAAFLLVAPDSIEGKIVRHLRHAPPGKAASLLDVLEYIPPALPCPLHTALHD